jgi:phage terminase large subunit GpA-like protein
MLDTLSIHAFIEKYEIKNEQGIRLDLKSHYFLFQPYSDFSPKLCIIKAAQIGATVMEVLKALWGVKNKGIDAVYILPTDSDVNAMVSSKVNRIIAQNPIFQQWTKDKDSIEQKQIGNNYIHYRGSWTQKAANMVTSDWNLYDEVDACKQDVVDQYSTRLQHSKLKWEHYFSHPSSVGTGIDKYWVKSDQKHWFITCNKCKEEQYMEWPKSFDLDKQIYVCKYCGEELSDEERRVGRWVAKYKNREFSGYWIPLFIAPWVSARDIIKYNKEKTEEYFYNKVLGLPYVGG